MNHDGDFVAEHFDELDSALRDHGIGTGLAEIHGMASGLVCAGRRRCRDDDWAAMLGEDAIEGDIRRVLDSVFSVGLNALSSSGFEFRPLLPGVGASISRRVECVADWCGGFIQGYMHAGGVADDEDASEAIEDIRAIAGVTPDDDDAEVQRAHLMQIEEYLRVAVQLLFDECRADEPSQPQQNRPR